MKNYEEILNYEEMLNISTNIKNQLGRLEDEIPPEIANETTDLIIKLINAWREFDTHICDMINENGYRYNNQKKGR